MSGNGKVTLGNLSTAKSFFETLKVERACWDTYLDYFDLLDRKMPCKDAAACFTEDAKIEYHMKGQPMVFNGRPNYLSFLEKATAAQEMTAHVVGQHRFVWSNSKPKLLSHVTSWQWFTVNAHRGDLRPAEFTTIGYSEDDFEYVASKWLIARRVVRPVAGLVAVGAPPPPLG